MFRHSTFAMLLWVLAVALLPIRAVNAHLHLCLDGQEQPVSLHVQDAPTHHGQAEGKEGHQDRDVEYSDSASTSKSASLKDVGQLLMTAYVIAVLLPTNVATVPDVQDGVATLPSMFDLRPPTRGPPA